MARNVERGSVDGQVAVVTQFDNGRTLVEWGGTGRPDGPGCRQSEIFGVGPKVVDFAWEQGTLVPTRPLTPTQAPAPTRPSAAPRSGAGESDDRLDDLPPFAVWLAALVYPRRLGTEWFFGGLGIILICLVAALLIPGLWPLAGPLMLIGAVISGFGYWWGKNVDAHLD